MRTVILLLLIPLLMLSGCGVTRTHVSLPDGSACSSHTYTVWKDVKDGQFSGCGAQWGVASSDPSAQMASMLGTINLLLPYALRAAQ